MEQNQSSATPTSLNPINILSKQTSFKIPCRFTPLTKMTLTAKPFTGAASLEELNERKEDDFSFFD